MFFSKKEQIIIEKFYKEVKSLTENDALLLIWENSKVEATFDTCFDDFDENNESDEFTSFVFKKKEITGTPPIEISEDNFFIINYHNFPEDIVLNNVKIN